MAQSSLLWLLPVLAVLCGCRAADSEPLDGRSESSAPAMMPAAAADPSAPDIRGVTLDARRRPADEELRRLGELGASHLFVIPFGWQRSSDSPSVVLRNAHDGWYSEDDDGIRNLDRRADSLGMSVVVKPHLWIRGARPADIRFESEEDWTRWETDYRAFALHYARLSAEIDAPLFVIGTELAGSALEREAYWRSLVNDVRAVYSGSLTYAANWWEEYEHVGFWDALDYVGVQAYFPLSDAARPSATVLRDGWSEHVRALASVAADQERPVLFTEIGYRSVGDAASVPWRWPSRGETSRPRFDLQADLYRSFFEQLWHREWFAGAVIWKWRPYAAADGASRRDSLDFTVRGKPAESVIGSWYGGEGAGRDVD